MYLADYHTHSNCSPDGVAPLTHMAQAAVEAGLRELCLTDHCDFLDYYGNRDLSFQWEPIEAQLSQARPLFRDRLILRQGLELGEAWEAPGLASALYHRPGVDFVLGSVHNLPSSAGGMDYYELRYDSDDSCYDCLDRYFDSMESLAAMDCYDALAHVIYPLRYMNGRDGCHVSLERYEPQLRRIFRTVIERGKGLELNTCRGRTVEDWRWTLALYKDCGGLIVTLGSDAHEPQHVGAGIEAGRELLRSLGFSVFATYENHNVILRKI